MSWVCELTEDAEKDLRELPRDVRRNVARVLDQIAAGPFQGDTKALKGSEWKGVFRRRAGTYRIFLQDGSPKQDCDCDSYRSSV